MNRRFRSQYPQHSNYEMKLFPIEPLETRIAPAFAPVIELSSLDGLKGFKITDDRVADVDPLNYFGGRQAMLATSMTTALTT